MGVTFFALLPKSNAFAASTEQAYSAVPIQDDGDELVNEEEPTEVDASTSTSRVSLTKPRLSTKQKLEIARPLFLPFMIPLFVVFFAEVRQLSENHQSTANTATQYTVNTGVSPTLLYPIPDRSQHPILGGIIRKLSDCGFCNSLVSRICGANRPMRSRLSPVAAGLPGQLSCSPAGIIAKGPYRHSSSSPAPAALFSKFHRSLRN